MKRIVSLIIVLFLLGAMAVPSFAHKDNMSLGKIDLYTGQITLDGVMDDAYVDYGRYFKPDLFMYLVKPPQTGYTAEFYCLFTNDYKELNIFVHVTDPTPLIPGAENHDAWNHIVHTDCVEMWVDPTNDCALADDSINGEAYHYRIDASGFVTGSFWGSPGMGNAASLPWVDSAMTYTATGYDFELVINCEAYEQAGLTTLERGAQWGFHLMAFNVYDEIHYQYEQEGNPNRWNMEVYCANMWALPCSICPEEVTLKPFDFDYIVLGNTVGDDVDPDDDPQGGDETTAPDVQDETTAPEDPQGGDETTAPGDPSVTDPADTTASDPNNPGDTGNETPNKENDPDETQPGKEKDDPGKKDPVRPAGDSAALALAALIISAGAAVVVMKKHR